MPEGSHRTDAVVQTTRRRLVAVGGAFVLSTLAGCQGMLSGNEWEFPEGSPSDPLRERTERFVEQVEGGSYEAATEPFTAELDEQLPPADLEATWSESVGHLGGYQGIGRWGHQEAEGNDLVFARVEREGGHYDLQLTFAGDRQISGVFIRDVVTNGE